MGNFNSFATDLYQVNDVTFDDIALKVFRFQAQQNTVYRQYLDQLGVNPASLEKITEIPFLPISFFKSHNLKTGEWQEEARFTSSGTTGLVPSVHEVKSLNFYLEHSRKCFEFFFGSLDKYHFLALMPSRLENPNSSLVCMMDYFIRKSGSESSGFYFTNPERMVKDISRLKKQGKRKVMLCGLTFALLGLAEELAPDLSDCMVFETGGMKGKRVEITRQELHEILTKHLNVEKVYSEYGMTELFSQAYTHGGDRFFCPPWLKVVCREIGDPFNLGLVNKTGGLNVVDLANIHSIAFIETEDAGKVHSGGSFEVAGRLDHSDVRGCNLLVE